MKKGRACALPFTTPYFRRVYWLTRRSMKVPLSSFTLFFSELTTEPWDTALAVVTSFKSRSPTTPSVFPVMGSCAFAAVEASGGVLLPVEALGAGGGVPPIPGARPPFEDAPLALALGAAADWSLPLLALPEFEPCGAMMAWIDIGISISPPFFMTARSNMIPTWESFCSLLRV